MAETNQHKPVVRALVLAETVLRDPMTRQFYILGTFNTIRARQLPDTYVGKASVYIAMTDILGEQDLSLRFVDLADGKSLVQSPPVRVRSNNPLGVLEIAAKVPRLPLPHPGAYSFDLMIGEELCGQIRVNVVGPGERDPAAGESQDDGGTAPPDA